LKENYEINIFLDGKYRKTRVRPPPSTHTHPTQIQTQLSPFPSPQKDLKKKKKKKDLQKATINNLSKIPQKLGGVMGGADSDKSECDQTREMRQFGTRSNRKR
jgi:hypothetical protein